MNDTRSRTLAVVGIIVISACARLFQFVPNMAPITALAVFGAFSFSSRRLAVLVPLCAMVVSDLCLALLRNDWGYAWHNTQWAVYGSFVLISLLTGLFSRRMTVGRVAGATVTGSVLFFVLTNFAVWMSSGLYEPTLSGLALCYTMAIPFFRNALLADSVYATLMFGALALAQLKQHQHQTVSARS